MLQPSFSKKNFFHTQGPLQFPETQAYVFRHRWGNPLSWFYPSSYTPGPAAQQFPKAHGRAGQRQSQGVTQHTEGRGGKRNWTEGKLGDLVDTAVFGDSKDLLLQFLFLNFFFSYILPSDKSRKFQTGEIPNERLKNQPLDLR